MHEDTRSRSGLSMSLGQSVVYAASFMQRLNTTSTTESELVGVSDAMPKKIWVRYFMEVQRYNVQNAYIY